MLGNAEGLARCNFGATGESGCRLFPAHRALKMLADAVPGNASAPSPGIPCRILKFSQGTAFVQGRHSDPDGCGPKGKIFAVLAIQN
jgi:hypothetical protein